jgi:hypothetical protein
MTQLPILATLMLLLSATFSGPGFSAANLDGQLIGLAQSDSLGEPTQLDQSGLWSPWRNPALGNNPSQQRTPRDGSDGLGSLSEASAPESDGHWNEMPPPPRAFHTAVYDPIRGRVIIFGGDGEKIRNEVWVLCPESKEPWSLLDVSGGLPPPLVGHSAVYDEVRDRILVFGGWDGNDFRNETWELTLDAPPTWRRLMPVGIQPGGRVDHTAIYDPIRDRMLVYGGFAGSAGPLIELWELSLSGTSEWRELETAGDRPRKRYGHTAIYDPLGDRMLIFGGLEYYCIDVFGCISSDELSDAWVLELSPTPSWVQLNPVGPILPARYDHSASYDSAGNRMLVFAGRSRTKRQVYDDLWALSLGEHPSWTRVTPSEEWPSARAGHSTVIDSRRKSLVMIGGASNYVLRTDVWEFPLDQETNWRRTAPRVETPPARVFGTLIYDADDDRTILFGGNLPFAIVVNDLWEFARGEPQGWQKISVSRGPPDSRALHTAVLDPVRRRMVVFGGADRTRVFDDLWSLELGGNPTWHELVAVGEGPGPRYSHTCLYDPKRDRMIIFGGYDEQGQQNDVWALSLQGPAPSWSQLLPEIPFPTGAILHSAVYDARRDRMLVFGGSIGQVFPSNETWELTLGDPPTWRKLTPLGVLPPPRAGHNAVCDADRDRMVVFGGSYENGTWALSLEGEPAWSQLHPGGFLPAGERSGHVAVFDPVRDQMLVFGGRAFGGTLSDTWILDWGARDRQIVIDIAPGKEPKRINRNSNAELKVAVFSDPPRCSGDPGFDARTIDPLSLRLAGASPRLQGEGTPKLKERDVNSDGYADIVVSFKAGHLDVDPSSRSVFLDGETYDGVNIRGKGQLQFVPPKGTAGTPGHLSITNHGYEIDELPYLIPEHSTVIRSGATLRLSFLVGEAGAVSIELFDVRGRRISSHSTLSLSPGAHEAELNLQRSIVPGVYYLRLTQNGQSARGKVVVIH